MGKQYQKEIEQILQGTESTTTPKKAGGKTSGDSTSDLSGFIAKRRLVKIFLLASLSLLLIAFIGSTFLPSMVITILIVIASLTFLIGYGALLVTISTKPNQ
jgi:hypothetical protein